MVFNTRHNHKFGDLKPNMISRVFVRIYFTKKAVRNYIAVCV